MKIGFINPSFRPLEINWEHDYEMVKLGVPTLMGYLYRGGLKDLRHWDFDAQVCEALEADRTAFDLRAYFDKEKVRGFVHGTDSSLRAQTEKLLDVLGVEACDVFGISLAAVLDRIANVMAIASVGQCLSVVLKERYPDCTVVFGGLQASPDSLHPSLYREMMEACPHIDYAYVGRGDERAVQFFRNLAARAFDRIPRMDGSMYRGTGTNGAPAILFGSGHDFDEDNRPPTSHATHHPAHVKSTAEQHLAELRARREGTELLAPSSLLRSSGAEPAAESEMWEAPPEGQWADTPHPFDDVDVADVRAAGPQAYHEWPARVPYFDKSLTEHFRYSGAQIMKRFHFDKELLLKYSRFENDTILVLPHIFMRGCNAPCGFCGYAYNRIEGEHVEETVSGLQWLAETYGCRHFHFLNTQINSVYAYAEAFCEEIIRRKLDILWSDCCNMRMLDERLLDLLRQSGAMRLVYGVEAPDDDMLKYIRKGVNVDKIERMLEYAHKLGIWNHVLLIAGMPHETRRKQDNMMAFLERTAEFVDFYSISSFYLISSSPWGKEPEKFGIRRISDPNGLLEEQAFDEIADGRWESDGLTWAQKKQQIVESTQRFYRTLGKAKGQTRCVAGNIDLYLLMFLYGALGHDAKSEIRRIYVETARRIDGIGVGGVRGGAASTGTAGPAQSARPPVAENGFRLMVPLIVGRMNEGDQASLVQLPVDLEVSAIDEKRPAFVKTRKFTFAYRTPRGVDGGAFARNTMAPVTENLPLAMRDFGKVLGAFAQSLEDRLGPTTREQMARLLTSHLPQHVPFQNTGFQILDAPETDGSRSIAERNLEWSGVLR